MRKIVMTLCLLILTTGIATAHPMNAPHNHRMPSPAPQRVSPPPKPAPVVYQVPVQLPNYSGCYNNSPYVTFSVGNVDVTLGL